MYLASIAAAGSPSSEKARRLPQCSTHDSDNNIYSCDAAVNCCPGHSLGYAMNFKNSAQCLPDDFFTFSDYNLCGKASTQATGCPEGSVEYEGECRCPLGRLCYGSSKCNNAEAYWDHWGANFPKSCSKCKCLKCPETAFQLLDEKDLETAYCACPAEEKCVGSACEKYKFGGDRRGAWKPGTCQDCTCSGSHPICPTSAVKHLLGECKCPLGTKCGNDPYCDMEYGFPVFFWAKYVLIASATAKEHMHYDSTASRCVCDTGYSCVGKDCDTCVKEGLSCAIRGALERSFTRRRFRFMVQALASVNQEKFATVPACA